MEPPLRKKEEKVEKEEGLKLNFLRKEREREREMNS